MFESTSSVRLLIFMVYSCRLSTSTNFFELNLFQPKVDDYLENRNAIKKEEYKWPGGIVPFVFDEKYSSDDVMAIEGAIKVFHEKTCIKFIPKKENQVEHIRFLKSRECGSNIGFRPNRSEPLDVTFSRHCLKIRGAIQHELLHVLGLLHEQSRPDRDDFINIIWDNIEPKYYSNFAKAPVEIADTFNLPYDYKSLMHYPNNAFAKSSLINVTMVAKINPLMKLGQSDGPTFYDLEKIRRMYNCCSNE